MRPSWRSLAAQCVGVLFITPGIVACSSGPQGPPEAQPEGVDERRPTNPAEVADDVWVREVVATPLRLEQDTTAIVWTDPSLYRSAKYLQQMILQSTGITFPVRDQQQRREMAAIVLSIDPQSHSTAREAFSITFPTGSGIAISGATTLATEFGVYDFLERDLGVRWLYPSPDGTIVPQVGPPAGSPGPRFLLVHNRPRHEAPAFTYRAINGSYSSLPVNSEMPRWLKRMRLTDSPALVVDPDSRAPALFEGWCDESCPKGVPFFPSAGATPLHDTFHHNMVRIFPVAEYRESHEIIYPLKNGVRTPALGANTSHDWQPVMDGEGGELSRDIAVSYFLEQFSDDASCPDCGPSWASVGINDSNNWGDAALAGRPRNSLGHAHLSEYYFQWVNQVVTEVVAHHPSARFGALAYRNLIDPPWPDGGGGAVDFEVWDERDVTSKGAYPAPQRIHPNVTPFVTYERSRWADPDLRARDELRTLAWSEATGTHAYYDYLFGGGWLGWTNREAYTIPRMHPRLMSEYLRFGADHGVTGYYAEAYPDETWIEGPKLYILAKLLWDPQLDVELELDRWYRAAVGPSAAPYLKAYFDFWEDYWVHRIPETYWFQANNHQFEYLSFVHDGYLDALTLEDLDSLAALMTEVELRTTGTEHEARGAGLVSGWRIVEGRIRDHVHFIDRDAPPPEYERIFAQGDASGPWSGWSRYSEELSSAAACDTSELGIVRLNLRPDDPERESLSMCTIDVPLDPGRKYFLRAEIGTSEAVDGREARAEIYLRWRDGGPNSHLKGGAEVERWVGGKSPDGTSDAVRVVAPVIVPSLDRFIHPPQDGRPRLVIRTDLYGYVAGEAWIQNIEIWASDDHP